MSVRNAISLRMARRFLRGGLGRLALGVLALTCGVALVCAMNLVSRAVLEAFVAVVDTVAGRAALTVTAGGMPFAESVAELAAGAPGVELAVPVVSATAFTADASGELLTVHGVDVMNESAVRVYEARDAGGLELDDPLVFLNQPDSIIITRTFAARRGLAVDDTLDLNTPNGRRMFTVRGLLEPQGIGKVYGGNLVVMDLPAAAAAFARPGQITRVDVVAQRDAQLDDVRAALAARLPAGLQVEAPTQRRADLQRIMQSLGVMLDAVSLLGLATAFLIILNRLTTIFETRARQLGVLRAVGMRARAVWFELLKESLVLGLAGVALGLPLGILAGRLLLPVVATTAALNFKLVVTEAAMAVDTVSLLAAVGLGLGTALLAAALPAWRVARRPPVETIRGRGVSPTPRRGVGWLLRGLVLAGIALTLVVQAMTHVPAWGLAATGLIIAAAALAARPVLEWLSPSILDGLRRVAGPSAQFARGTFARNSGRAVLTIAMIGVGIGAIIWMRTLAYSFETSLVHALSGALQGDWVVTSSHIMQGYVEAPVDERLVDDVRGLDGAGEAVGERLVDWHHVDGPIAIDAFDGRYFTTTALGRWPLVGAAHADVWDALATGRAVLISSSFAVNLGVGVGDRLSLETQTGMLDVPVAGVTVNFSSPRGTIIMARELYRQHWGDAQVNRVFVRAAPGADPAALRTAIAQQLGLTYGLRIIAAHELIDYFATQVQRAFAPLDVLAALLLFVLLLGLADTLAASVLERTSQLAVIRTLGARRGLLRRAVMIEGLGLALPGLLLALVAGLGLGFVWVRQTFPYLLGWALETHIPYGQISAVCAATLAVGWLAGLLPARRAAGLDPARALRCE